MTVAVPFHMATRVVPLISPRHEKWLRISLAIVLALAGLSKLMAPSATAYVLREHGVPDPEVIGVVFGVLELAAALLVLLVRRVRRLAFTLVLFYTPIALVFHWPFGRGAGAANGQILNLVFDASIIAGLWVLATRAPERRKG